MAIVSLVIVAGAIYAIAIWYPRRVDKKVAALKASGRQGEATILRLPPLRKDAGASNAIYRRMAIGLEIRVPGVAAYEIDKNFSIPTSHLRLLEIGKIVPVWIDPNNPRNPDKIVIHIE